MSFKIAKLIILLWAFFVKQDAKSTPLVKLFFTSGVFYEEKDFSCYLICTIRSAPAMQRMLRRPQKDRTAERTSCFLPLRLHSATELPFVGKFLTGTLQDSDFNNIDFADMLVADPDEIGNIIFIYVNIVVRI